MLGRIIIHDVAYGLRKNYGKIILFFVFMIFFSLAKAYFYIENFGEGEYGGMGIVCVLLAGMSKFQLDLSNPINFPAEWLFIVAFLPFLLGDYVTLDLRDNGIQRVLLAGRKSWWLGKCAWMFVTVCIYMIILYGVPYGVAALLHSTQNVHGDFIIEQFGYYGMVATPLDLVRNMLLLPFLCMLAIAVWTTVLGLIWEPSRAFMSVCIYLVLGIFIMNPYLIGNQIMLYRREEVTQGGVNVNLGIAMDIILILLGVLFGYYYIQRKDLLGGKK